MPVEAGELKVGGLPRGCDDREADEDGMLRGPFEGIFDFFVTVLAEADTLVKFGFYGTPGPAMCAADTEVLLGRIKMMK